MGYSIFQIKSQFFIASEAHLGALLSIKELIRAKKNIGFQISFVEISEIEESESLVEILEYWRWIPELNENGDIVDIDFGGEKLGDDYLLFDCIAPFVKENSFITMIGDDSRVWRWIFMKGKVQEQEGKLIFNSLG